MRRTTAYPAYAFRPGIIGPVLAIVASLLVIPPAPAEAAAACGPRVTKELEIKPWPLRRLRPELVWPLTKGETITVAVIDSGVSRDHPSLAGQVLDGVDTLRPGQPGTCDEAGHGTVIAGIIAGRESEGSGFHGIAPGAKILPIRVLASREKSTSADDPQRIANAIRTATDRDADVINLSLTTPSTPQLENAIQYALSNNVVVVAAAGNIESEEQIGVPMYPAAYPGVIGVAGVDDNGIHVPSSATGHWVDIAAPGLLIDGPAAQGGGYAFYPDGGTSFAAAYVSGAVALLRAYRPDLSATAIARRLMATADQPPDGWDPNVGNGVVNPNYAIGAITENVEELETTGGQVVLPVPAPDPLGRTRVIALLAALGAACLAIIVLTGAWVLRRGRRRAWRPGPAPTG